MRSFHLRYKTYESEPLGVEISTTNLLPITIAADIIRHITGFLDLIRPNIPDDKRHRPSLSCRPRFSASMSEPDKVKAQDQRG